MGSNQLFINNNVCHRNIIIFIVFLTAILFCMPLIITLIMDAGFLNLANEPLAYRFFYSERIFLGDTVAVGVGYSISILHHIVYAVTNYLLPYENSTLEARLDFFAFLTNIFISITLCILLFFALKSNRLKIIHLVMLCTLTLVPIYGTRNFGFNYALSADYNFLNILICIATLLIFQEIWLYEKKISSNYLILISIFVGFATANKITMLVLTGVVLVPAVFVQNISWKELYLRSILAIRWLVISFFTIHLASYLGRTSKLRTGFRIWWNWALNPGGEPAFWDQVLNLIIHHNYIYMIIFSFIVLLLTMCVLLTQKKNNFRDIIVTAYCGLAFLVCFYFIFKRPATSTLFESSIFLLTLSFVLLTVFFNTKNSRKFVIFSCCFWIILSSLSFSFSTVYNQIIRSREDSHLKWAVFQEVLNLAGNLPIEIIFPNNNFRHEGPFELILKGASDFPSSWTINSGQKTVIERYAPLMTFRNDSSDIKPEMPYLEGRVLVWFDLNQSQKLENKYIELKKILLKEGVKRIKPEFYSNSVIMNIAIIPSVK